MDETEAAFAKQLKSAQGLFKNSTAYKKHFSKKMSDIEKREQDLLHYLEIENLSAVELTRLVVTLRDLRKERREIKNMMTLTMQLTQGDVNGATLINTIMKNGDVNENYAVRSDIIEKTFGDNRKFIKIK